jgi:hypothetical protein
MIVTTGGRGTASAPSSLLSVACVGIFRSLFFEGDDFGVGSEEARHLAGQFRVERLIDGREHAAHHQARDHILGANAQLLGQVFYRDSFRNRDVPRDRRRLVADETCAAAECSPSSGLPSLLAAHIFVPDAVTGSPDELPDAMVPAAAIPAPGPTPSGRDPAGATRVGCIGRRSPGRSGGRDCPGASGRAVR